MPPSPPHRDAPRSLHVLLVDDHTDSAALLCMLLERRGYAVTVAGSVATALAAGAAAPFDVLVCDIELPDGKGHEVVQLLRAARPAGSAPLPAIALSGLDSEAEVQRAREAGFDEYLGKPVGVDALVGAIQRVCAA